MEQEPAWVLTGPVPCFPHSRLWRSATFHFQSVLGASVRSRLTWADCASILGEAVCPALPVRVSCRYQQILHRNLVYLATIADSNQNMQSLLPAVGAAASF